MRVESLHIDLTEETPEIDFNVETKRHLVRGRSLPEDAFSFYGPLIDWMTRYASSAKGDNEIVIHMDYFNSSSGRYLMELLIKAESFCRGDLQFSVLWIADEDDEVMIDKGEEFKSILDLPFQIKKS